MSLEASENLIYSNCIVRSPTGDAIFRCDHRKMQWYLEHGLAKQIQSDPPRIQLIFQPNGPGHFGDPFFLQQRKNICVVCGTSVGLTRHHILQHSYRRWFPRTLDHYGTYDVMALCVAHHEAYNLFERRFRQRLAHEFNAPIGGIGGRANPATGRAASAVRSLRRHRSKIPAKKVAVLEKIIADFFGGAPPEDAELRRLVRENKTPHKTHSEMLVEQLDGFEELGAFVVRWRKHFLQHMKPQFMPEHWEIDRIFFEE